jgi:phosphoribosyl 1,2-cyclic phosphodiesterase
MKAADNDIRIKFWGVRGSIPTPGREFVRYGGNTSCVGLRCGDTIIILDAGTGMRELGRSLVKEFNGDPLDLHILISHTHWDHIQGFPFLDLAYIKGNKISLYGGQSVSSLEKLILGQMDREYFPVTLFELSANVEFVELMDNPFDINDLKVYFTHLFHPALSLGYRIEYNKKVIVYATDNEILNDPEMAGYNVNNVGYLIRDADVLITDCQYTSDEYKKKIGWGHSSIEEVVKLANSFGVKNLFPFHYDPLHTDEDIDDMIAKAREIARKPLKVHASKEKMSVIIP